MKYNILFRITLILIIFVSIIFGLWFIALPVVIFANWMYSFRIETLIAGVFYDALFGMIPGTYLYGYIGTITAILLIVIMYIAKKVVR